MKNHANHQYRHAFPMSSEVSSHTVCEMYSAVKKMSDGFVLRAAEDITGLCIYSTKKTNKLAELTYKSATVSAHKKAMRELIYRTCDAVSKEPMLDSKDLRALAELSWEASNSVINGTDIPVNRIREPLRHLNNRIQRSERMRKAAELKSEQNAPLKRQREYLTLFTKIDESDLNILRQALFKRDKSISLADQKIILRSVFVLVNAYLTQSGQRKTLAQMIRRFPQPDMLLKFAEAWLAHIEGYKINHPNLLVTFSWQKTMTSLAEKIRRELGKAQAAKSLYFSPARVALRGGDAANSLLSPTKLPQNEQKVHDEIHTTIPETIGKKITAFPVIVGSTAEAINEEAPLTSLPSLPDIPDIEEIVAIVSESTDTSQPKLGNAIAVNPERAASGVRQGHAESASH